MIRKLIQTVLPILVIISISCRSQTSSSVDNPVEVKSVEGLGNIFVKIAEEVEPAVVNISTVRVIKEGTFFHREFRSPFQDEFFDDFFERFFEFFPHPRSFKERSLGSGVIIKKEGYILTNCHVIKDATDIKVTLTDKREFKGKVVGLDKKTDLAVIKVDAKGDLPVVKLGDSERLRIGEWVIAIGNPFGLEHTVTVGVVSAKGRDLEIQGQIYEGLLQTDASINPGNSGGPLVDIHGRVVGINTAIVSPTGIGSVGIGFAIPINKAKEIINDLIEKGKVIRGWLGIIIQELTPALKEALNFKEDGVLVSDVLSDSPASKGGLKRGDIIIECNGIRVKEVKQLQDIVAKTRPEKEVNILIVRDGVKEILSIKIGEMPEEGIVFKPKEGTWLGVTVQDLTRELREHFDLEKGERGVLITDVEVGSPADEAGLQQGDLIKEVNEQKIHDVSKFEREINKIAPGKSCLLLIKRKEHTFFVVAKREE
ncbi:MAG: Do family serine endopeptidase [bacterium]|nr:Do family serine endopeptidase [bacterium]